MEFLKILWDNLKKGPVTDAFPFGETYTPDRLRGRVEIDPALCVGCGTCVHVCAAGAINISKFEERQAASRSRCGATPAACAAHCPATTGPTKASTLTNDGTAPHRPRKKYTQINPRQGQIRLLCAVMPGPKCAFCRRKCSKPHLRQSIFRSRRGRESRYLCLPELAAASTCGRGKNARLSYRPARKDGRPRGSLFLVPPRKRPKRPSAETRKNHKGSSRSGGLCPEKQPAPSREAYGTSPPSPTLRLQGGAERPGRLRLLNRPLTQQPKRGPIRLPARKAPLKKPSPAAGNTAD